MEKNPQGISDEAREGYCKGMMKPTKRVSDNILPHILNLYASRATFKDFEIYVPHATFEDPLMCAHGVNQIKSAFYSLAKVVFSESRIVDYSIKENIIAPGNTEILIDNKQFYKFLGRDINVISLIKLYTEDGKVIHHEDWWDKKPLWNRETVRVPLAGRIIEATRRASMLVTHALMRFGKDPPM
ncbi:Nuclear transport factor 2 (NTF2) family protein [Striga hermonthica]|uniref:Nuclear transport factor 2 (NTF2) family protein n=1 Tax=Striga hermonthica TaxID=68872 RepID=A0A9N7P423_STRHE|nr:Nuclear transport factor 2 (NTF2) family protein [Striga hermonthica]